MVSITGAALIALENPKNASIGAQAIVHKIRPDRKSTILGSYLFIKK